MSNAEKSPDALKVGSIGRKPPRKRFYREVSTGSHPTGFCVLLDDCVAKTPGGKPLAVRSEAVAKALAAEWSMQGERLDPAAMPLTRLVNSAVDGVASQMEAVRADIVRYADSDLVCYRADGPKALIALQDAHWSPLLTHVREVCGAHLVLVEGIMHIGQEHQSLAAIDRALEEYDTLSLAAIHAVTTLTGSAVIALALAQGAINCDAAWIAAHVDEDWQMSQWGRDDQALERRALRWLEMEAASLVLDR